MGCRLCACCCPKGSVDPNPPHQKPASNGNQHHPATATEREAEPEEILRKVKDEIKVEYEKHSGQEDPNKSNDMEENSREEEKRDAPQTHSPKQVRFKE